MRIKTWQEWSKIYMDTAFFEPLVDEILFHLNKKRQSHLIPMGFSTNAVFKVDQMIVKLFAPAETGANTPHDYYVELASIEAVSPYISTPLLLGNGLIEGKNDFYYIVTPFIEGVIARDYFKSLSTENRFIFGRRIRHLLHDLAKVEPADFFQSIKHRYLIHPTKYDGFNQTFKDELLDFHNQYSITNPIYVHGDITEDNIIIDKNDNLYLIDFADSAIGPIDYEYPPIIYGLFDMDKDAMTGFIGYDLIDLHLERLFIGTLLHEYGGDFIRLFLNRIQVELSELTSLLMFKTMLYNYYKK